MSSKKDNNNWSMSYSYKLTPESQRYFYDWNGVKPTAQRRHEVEKEMQLLRDIDIWVDIMDGDYPDAKAIIEKIKNK